MVKLTNSQLKELAQYLNGVAVAWYTAGVISPFFAKFEGYETLKFATIGLVVSLFSLSFSIYLVRGLKI